MTIQPPTNNSSAATHEAPVNESVIAQLANELFAALPQQNIHALNFELPDQALGHSHHPQPKDPIAALSGRIPAVVQQAHLNPKSTQHYVEPTADHPERRILSSAPISGGAHTPDPFIVTPDLDLALNSTSASPSTSPTALAAPEQSHFYFLDFAQIETLDSQNVQHHIKQIKGTKNPYAFDDYHVTDDHHLKSTVQDRNDKAATPESGYYFLQSPSIETDRPHSDWQIPTQTQTYQALDILQIRKDFPILQERVNGQPLIWLDNAATTHKPQAVIDRISYFYQHENSNIHRAAHELAARASDAYEHARDVVARFIGAPSAKNIVFVRGTTEGINLIAKSWGKQNIQAGDEIIVSHLEHHANIVPWYQLSQETGAKLRVIPVDDTGQIQIEEFIKLLNPKTKLVSITQVSNALGTVTPTQEIITLAHAAGVRVLIDGAQSVSHVPTNVSSLDADFFVFSGHKVFGPTGIGAVYAKAELLDSMPVWEGGGNMIQDVTFENVIYQPAPNKFEAGTGNIADAVGLGAALEYIERIGIHNIARYEHDLLEYGQHALQSVSGLRLIGTALNKASVMSFTLAGYETEEVGKVLNQHGVAVRTGHHCAQPILRRFGVERTVRPSLAFYNTTEEIDVLVSVLHQLRRAKPYRSVPSNR